MSIQMPYTLDENEQAVLDALEGEGRANPMLLREKTDLRKQYVNDALTQLQKADRVRKVSRGLYEYVGEEGEERDDVPTREIVDDWLWEHYGFGVDTLDDLDPERAREALEEARIHFSNLNRDGLGDALDELGEALGVEEDDG